MPEPSAADVRAVLFDLDGTLLNTLEDIGRSANETLEESGNPPISSHRIVPAVHRRRGTDALCCALPAGVDAAAFY